MDQNQLLELQSVLKTTIAAGELKKAVDALLLQLPASSDKYNIAVHLSRQYADLKVLELKGVLPFEVIQQRQTALSDNVLTLIDILSVADFVPAGSSGAVPAKKYRTGGILYSIPDKMEIGVEKKCLIRLAFDAKLLLEGLGAGGDNHISELRRIDKRMEIELIDPSEEKAFAMRTISSPMQIVEEDDLTEWIFFIKPVLEGKHPLYLKVSVIIIDEQERIRKELVLEQEIEVVSTLSDEEKSGLAVSERRAGLMFFLAAPAAAVPDDAGDSTDTGSSHTPSGDPVAGAVKKGLLHSVRQYLPQAAVSLAITATVAGYFLWKSPQGSATQNDPTQVSANQDATLRNFVIEPPLADINVAPEVIRVLPNRAAEYILKSGASIEIPAAVFCDENGQPVTTPVDIRFRKFFKASELLASGMPMRVVQGGKEAWMKTSGMYEISGSTEGKPVNIITGKSITVHLDSPDKDPCDFWRLNKETGNWEVIGRKPGTPKTTSDTNTDREETDDNDDLAQGATAVLKPAKIDKRKRVLDFNINYNALPELKSVGKVLWQYAGNDPTLDPDKNPALINRAWDNVKVERSTDPEVYTMTLIAGKDKLQLPVKPCLSEQAFSKAMENYQKAVEKQEGIREKRRTRQAFEQKQEQFVRSFDIDRFGVYNWDYLIKRDEAVQLAANFNFGEDLPDHLKKSVKVCLVCADNRSVIVFPYSDWSKFSFIPAMDNKLVALLPDNKLAVYSKDDFTREAGALRSAQGGNFTFYMQTLPEPIESLDDLDKVLQ